MVLKPLVPTDFCKNVLFWLKNPLKIDFNWVTKKNFLDPTKQFFGQSSQNASIFCEKSDGWVKNHFFDVTPP